MAPKKPGLWLFREEKAPFPIRFWQPNRVAAKAGKSPQVTKVDGKCGGGAGKLDATFRFGNPWLPWLPKRNVASDATFCFGNSWLLKRNVAPDATLLSQPLFFRNFSSFLPKSTLFRNFRMCKRDSPRHLLAGLGSSMPHLLR